MCLEATTSRKPMFTTAYKIICYSRGVYKFPYYYFSESLNPHSDKWLKDDYHDNIYYYYQDVIGKTNLYKYKTGFHSFVKLEDAIERLNDISFARVIKLHQIWEIDTDDIVEYGVENQKDVVVSRKIKFIQRII